MTKTHVITRAKSEVIRYFVMLNSVAYRFTIHHMSLRTLVKQSSQIGFQTFQLDCHENQRFSRNDKNTCHYEGKVRSNKVFCHAEQRCIQIHHSPHVIANASEAIQSNWVSSISTELPRKSKIFSQ